mgnify:FL=1
MDFPKGEILSPIRLYEASVSNGFRDDPSQREVLSHLTILQQTLNSRISSNINLKDRIFSWIGLRGSEPNLKGLYIWGGVGRGKTHVMDLFYESLVVPKQRLHFHRFMAKVHRALTEKKGTEDPLLSIAGDFAAQAKVICFDEFFVSDIGDAMILGELLSGLFARGVILVATSNVAPNELYENGLQRKRFLPAIALLQEYTDIIKIGGDKDYRLDSLRRTSIYEVLGSVEYRVYDKLLELSDVGYQKNKILNINDRPICTLYSGVDEQGIAAFEFCELCDGPRSNNDYIELARIFHTVLIVDIPRLTESYENQTRRFIGLIDEFYDRKVKVLFVAQVKLLDLYQGSLLAKEFERTKSRISEMQSDDYLSRPHRP